MALYNSKPHRYAAAAYSELRAAAWLRRLRLPASYEQYLESPSAIPKTYEVLRVLFRCQISVFPYENLTVHYSPSHLVSIDPSVLYRKMMEPTGSRGRGGYCMELSIFFHHMLRALGFRVTMTGVRNRTRTDGIPSGQYQGWTHINNIIYLPDGTKYSADVAFGGDGPTAPLRMDDKASIHQNLGSQQVRLIHDTIDKQQLTETRLWIYQYRNGQDREWNSFYSFSELEFFQEDFEVQNWWACAHTLHRWTVLVVRFLRDGEPVEFPVKHNYDMGAESSNIEIAGKVMLVNNVIKVNMGGRTTVLHELGNEEERISALRTYFGIELADTEMSSINGWDMSLQ